ncbi:hypothetical protein QN277_016633 [Acacia crassicarpa]|uniref:Water stress and hypersensitive response domain-containing protein n=1 Tax=Acacia crassicarpa TaxID=499986 RepID=A0AAE1MX56_9FABA|nr:hypothetical protein QN277_016633 [Acacia crassicarpa]
MSSSDKPEVVERDVKDEEQKDIKNTHDNIKLGSVIHYTIKADFIAHINHINKNITKHWEKTGEIPIPFKLDVDLEKIHFKSLSFEETVAVLHLKLENKNDFDLGLTALDYEICVADVSIGGAELAKSAKIEKSGISYIDIPFTFRPKDFGSALWDMIRGKGTVYSIKGNISAETPFGAMKLPISKEGGTTRLKKDGDGDNDEE